MQRSKAVVTSTFAMPRPLAAAAALLSGVCFVALSIAAPPPRPITPPAFDATWFERVFPGVPQEWVELRLAALVSCLVWATWATWGRWRDAGSGGGASKPMAATPGRVALACAGCLALVGMFGLPARRSFELAYIACLTLPTWLLVAAGHPAGRVILRRPRHGLVPLAMTAWLVVAWTAYRLFWVDDAYRVPTGMDFAAVYQGLRATLEPNESLLTSTQRPGFTSLLTILQGPIVLGLGSDALRPRHLQVVHTLWAAVTAIGLGVWSKNACGAWTAPAVAATFLASTATAMASLFPAALFLGPLLATVLLLLGQRIERDGDPGALVACASVAGCCFTHPSLFPLGGVTLGALALRWWRAADWRSPVWGTAGLMVVAVAAPGVSWGMFQATTGPSYYHAKQMWAAIEAAALGIAPLSFLELDLSSERQPGFDVVTGMLLAPWMTPRTPLRAIGDGWLEPVGAILCALGLAGVVGNLGHSARARRMALFFAITLGPGFISSYDRPSITRALALPAVLAALAGVGLAAMTAGRSRSVRVACGALLPLASLGLGAATFDHWDPGLLPHAAMSTAIESGDAASRCRPSRFATMDGDPLRLQLFGDQLPRCRLKMIDVGAIGAWMAESGEEILYWTAAVEDEHHVRDALCGAKVASKLFVLWDRTGLVPVFAGSRGNPDWQPDLNRARWRQVGCDDSLPTEATRARAALEQFVQLPTDQGIDLLRRESRAIFFSETLHLTLAQALLERGRDEDDLLEALRWSEFVMRAHRWRSLTALRVHREAAARLGRQAEHRQLAVRTLDALRFEGRVAEAAALQEQLDTLGLDPER